MLAVPWAAPFSDDGWSFELKWDGVRTLLFWDGSSCRLVGRRGTDYSPRYPEVAGVHFDRPVVLDGEIVALGDDGAPSFERLQQRMHLSDPAAVTRMVGEVPVAMVTFDILFEGTPVVDELLVDRQERLAGLDLPAPLVRSDVVPADGLGLWDAVTDRHLEGIVAKRLSSPYRSGVRSPDWRKVAHVGLVEAVIGGFTAGEGGRAASFGALLLGLWDGDRLRWVGAAGTGFSDEDLRRIRSALEEMARPDPPFLPDPDLPSGATWVEPVLVASIGYRDWTSVGRLRHPRFRGFTDTPVDEVTWGAVGPS
jgi:bifunctional non-homologous end joining protein LigD